MNKKIEQFKKRMDFSIIVGIMVFMVAATLVLYLNKVTNVTLAEFVLELNGFMLDVFVFGVLIVWLNKKREQNSRQQSYVEQLEDFRFWKSEEGVNRKIGILRRLQENNFEIPPLNRYELPGAYLKDFRLDHTNMSKTNLSGAFCLNTRFVSADLSETNFEKAYLESTNLNNAKLYEAYLGWVDLRTANLSNADLRCSNMELAILWNANLQHADLEAANLDKADLTKANLAHAFCYNTSFGQANLANTELKNADLRGADLQHVENLTSDQLKDALIDQRTKFPFDLEVNRDQLISATNGSKSKRQSSFDGAIPSFRQRPKTGTYRVTQTL